MGYATLLGWEAIFCGLRAKKENYDDTCRTMFDPHEEFELFRQQRCNSPAGKEIIAMFEDEIIQ